MTGFNKIQLASDMFVEAHACYTNATRDIDYIMSILLSGAIVGIINPLLKEQGGHTMHELLARISNAIAEPGENVYEGMFREIYNSLKHAGNPNKKEKIAPSEDLEIQADLKQEAAHMLDAAKNDFRHITVQPHIKDSLSESFLLLLQLDANYA
jgi:hypothetical protein